MIKYDMRTLSDAKGDVKGVGEKGKDMAEGKKVGEFLPNEVKITHFKRPGAIAKFKYPDTAEAIETEQHGNVGLAAKDRASVTKRK